MLVLRHSLSVPQVWCTALTCIHKCATPHWPKSRFDGQPVGLPPARPPDMHQPGGKGEGGRERDIERALQPNCISQAGMPYARLLVAQRQPTLVAKHQHHQSRLARCPSMNLDFPLGKSGHETPGSGWAMMTERHPGLASRHSGQAPNGSDACAHEQAQGAMGVAT